MTVENPEQAQVDEERAQVDQQVAEHAGRDHLGQPERQPGGDRRHQRRVAGLVRVFFHCLHCALPRNADVTAD